MASLSSLVYCLWVSSGAYPRVAHLKGASLRSAPAFLVNIRLDWEGLPGTNTLAYIEIRKLRSKKFYSTGPGENKRSLVFQI
jgi:hypothetical protein